MAVSGGVDSVVLLHLLRFLPQESRPRLAVAHFDHNLRGRASAADRRFVRGLCASWGVPFLSAKAPRWRTRENVEARARQMRYRFLVRAARKFGSKKIATAHHADDQLETFAMRWIQGAGLRGLSGMRPRRALEDGGVEVIRPLIDATRAEILACARATRLPYRDDATNRSRLYLRNRLRQFLRSLQRENPNLAERTALNAIFLQADEDRLNAEIQSMFQRHGRRSFKGIGKKADFPLFKYRLMPGALRYRLIQKMAQSLLGESYALPAVAVLKVDEILQDLKYGQSYDLPSGLGLEKGRQRFVFFRKSPKNSD
ncbi:MAG TPA: tRNA lysidine(34) synthetase TilS [bacterium]|nr:tRNA lysidine(34) synthetase TilS [bacterium]